MSDDRDPKDPRVQRAKRIERSVQKRTDRKVAYHRANVPYDNGASPKHYSFPQQSASSRRTRK